MKAHPALVFILALAVEILALTAFAAEAVAGQRLLAFLALHAFSSVSGSFALLRWMPRLLRRRPAKGYLFFLALTFFMPFLGALAMFTGLVLPLLLPRRDGMERPVQSTEIPDLPYRPLIVSSQPIYGAVGLVGVIRHSKDVGARLRAVMATRQLTDKLAVPILQVALRDPVDDVRLLAYALLDGKERIIYANVKEISAKLTEAPPSLHGSLHKRLAQEYWELVYLGLAQGEVLAHVLAKADDHARKAIEALRDDAGVRFLHGRILMAKGMREEARRALDDAEALGLPNEKLLPYRADLAFQERAFDEVVDCLRALPEESKKRPPLAAVVEYWCAR